MNSGRFYNVHFDYLSIPTAQSATHGLVSQLTIFLIFTVAIFNTTKSPS